MKKIYKYCTVVPKFRETDFYYYLDRSGKIKKGSYVIAPFGDDSIIGMVSEVALYDEENVPYPVDKMKNIRRIISKEEYDEFTYAEYVGADESEKYELFELDRVFIKETCKIGTILSKFWYDEAQEYLYKVKPEGNFDSGWEFKSYSCYELEKIEIIGKIKYIGDKINNFIEPDKEYEVFGGFDIDTLRVINNGMECLYNIRTRHSTFFPDLIMKWKIIEDIDGKISRALRTPYKTMPKADNGDNNPYYFLTWISYEKFKQIYEKVNGEPEYYVYLEDKPDEEYMIIRYKDGPSFQRCGVKDGSGEIEFENLDKLYESETIDGICLKRDWDKVRICPNGYESIEEFCWVHDIDLKI